jgi:hypothetical protein
MTLFGMRLRRRPVVMAGSAAVGAALVVLFQSVATGSPTLIVRGVQADPETFSFTTWRGWEYRPRVAGGCPHSES